MNLNYQTTINNITISYRLVYVDIDLYEYFVWIFLCNKTME